MLSLPLITPRHDPTLWPTHTLSQPANLSAESDTNALANLPHHASHHPRRPPPRTLLTALTADENNILSRKTNIRRFGAGWIRPPGVLKTYQATMDEAAEREEQEILARREQALLDMQAQQEEAARVAGMEREGEEWVGEGMEGEEGEGERDLDDEVPEAEESEGSSVGSDEEESGMGDTTTADVTFNEGSFIEGSMLEAQVEQMLEMEEAEMSGVAQDERDLDDDVPEAGSYEHTDTELDDSSDLEEGSFAVAPSTGRRSFGGQSRRTSARYSTGGRTSGGRAVSGGQTGPLGINAMGSRVAANPEGRSSFLGEGSSSIVGGSSFLESSPAATRGTGIGNAFRNRLMSRRGG